MMMAEKGLKEFGMYLERLRKRNGLSQESLAESLSITRPTYAAVEDGERELKVSEAEILANIFQIPLQDFINQKDIELVIEKSKARCQEDDTTELRILMDEENKEKFKQVFLYILSRIGSRPNIGMTVLYKILYFIDFDYYEKFETQLMGLQYFKNHFGPTPYSFKSFVNEMIKCEEIEKVKSSFFEKDQTKYLPLITPDISVLSAQEIKHIDWELERFKEFTAHDISELSHRDVPWISSENGQKIEYESVFYRTEETSQRRYGDEKTPL